MGEYQNFLVKADTERLLEVLQNIIENAIKYGSGKKIGISISKEEDCVLITVENTGGKSFFGNCGSGYGKLVNEKGRKKM